MGKFADELRRGFKDAGVPGLRSEGPSLGERIAADTLAEHMAARGSGLPHWMNRLTFARNYRIVAKGRTGTFKVYVSMLDRRVWLIEVDSADWSMTAWYVATVELVDGRFAEYA